MVETLFWLQSLSLSIEFFIVLLSFGIIFLYFEFNIYSSLERICVKFTFENYYYIRLDG